VRALQGRDACQPGRSAFEEDQLAPLLRRRQITDVTVTGVATEDGVPQTALDAIAARFAVSVDSAAIAGLDEEPGDVQRVLATIERPGGRVWRLSRRWPLGGVRHSAA
jgi:nicotinamidase-related amidase